MWGRKPAVTTGKSITNNLNNQTFWQFINTVNEWQVEYDGIQSTVKSFRVYRPEPDNQNVLTMLQDTDATVINIGLHYVPSQHKDYYDMILGVLGTLKHYASVKPLMWRQTSAQHLFADGGEWLTDDEKKAPEEWNVSTARYDKEKNLCKPLRYFNHTVEAGRKNLTSLRQWRESIVLQVAEVLGYRVEYPSFQPISRPERQPQHPSPGSSSSVCKYFTSSPQSSPSSSPPPILFIIPFQEMTEPLWDMHSTESDETNQNVRCEPTHYCSTPFVWEHIYDLLYRVLQRSAPFCRASK